MDRFKIKQLFTFFTSMNITLQRDLGDIRWLVTHVDRVVLDTVPLTLALLLAKVVISWPFLAFDWPSARFDSTIIAGLC